MKNVCKFLILTLLFSDICFPITTFAQNVDALNAVRSMLGSQGGRATNNRGSAKVLDQNPTQPFASPSGIGGGDMWGSMGYQVHVLGQVAKPGTYRFNPSVRLAEAIAMAGGMAKQGSIRYIELKQGSGSKRTVDLFRYIYKGDLNSNPFLQDNDVIFVPFASQSVRIEGPVKKSGVYELADEKNVWDMIQLSGGFTAGVSEQEEVVVIRYGESEKKNLIRIPNVQTELEKTPIQGGDIIVIPHIFTKGKKFDYAFPELPSDNIFYPSYNDNVFVSGAVSQGGPYAYNPVLGVREYVGLAGPIGTANIKGARILTAEGRIVRNIGKHSLSPGDTIIVPEKKVTTGKVLAWYNTLASTVFTGVALKTLVE